MIYQLLPDIVHNSLDFVDLVASYQEETIHQGRTVRKPVNFNQGLNVTSSTMFSCLKLFFALNIWCSLRLLQLKIEGQTI